MRNQRTDKHVNPFCGDIAEEDVNKRYAQLLLLNKNAGGAKKLECRHKQHNRDLLEMRLSVNFCFGQNLTPVFNV